MPESIHKSWERLEKRILKFNETYPAAHIICIALVDNYYRSAGNQQMKSHFTDDNMVKNKYREIIEGQSVMNQNAVRNATEDTTGSNVLHDSVQDCLSKHCFDMDMNEIRTIITTVLSPPDRPQGTGRMRGFYSDFANCPAWWRETSVPFASLNNPRAGQKRATMEDGYKLIEALQEFYQVFPPRPTKIPNSSIHFRSRFYADQPDRPSGQIDTGNDGQMDPGNDGQVDTENDGQMDSGNDGQVDTENDGQMDSGNDGQVDTENDGQIDTGNDGQMDSGNDGQVDTENNGQMDSGNDGQVDTENDGQMDSGNDGQIETGNDGRVDSGNDGQIDTGNDGRMDTGNDGLGQMDSGNDGQIDKDNDRQTRREQLAAFDLRKELYVEHLVKEKRYDDAMKTLGNCDWPEFCHLCEMLKFILPDVPKQLCGSFNIPNLAISKPLYKRHIPNTVQNRVCKDTKADGNCIYNSISICLYGNEDNASMLRLASAVHMSDKIIDYTKYILTEFKDNPMLWISSICDSKYQHTGCEIGAAVEIICKEEILSSLKNPYRECTLLHLHMIADLLQRPIINHFAKKHFMPLGTCLYPPLSDVIHPASIHLVWVPSKPNSRYASLTHVVPAVSNLGPYGVDLEECGFEGLQCCAFLHGSNPESTPMWIECTRCGQWVHDVCIKMNASTIKDTDMFLCGCQHIDSNKKIKLSSLQWYSNLTVQNCKEFSDFEDVVNDTSVSYRRYMFGHGGSTKNKMNIRVGRFGPFEARLIDDIVQALSKISKPVAVDDVINIHLYEVLLRVIENREDVNRLSAEYILLGNFC